MPNVVEASSFIHQRADGAYILREHDQMSPGCKLGCLGMALVVLGGLYASEVLLDPNRWTWWGALLVGGGLGASLLAILMRSELRFDDFGDQYTYTEGIWPWVRQSTGALRDLKQIEVEAYVRQENRSSKERGTYQQTVVGFAAFLNIPSDPEAGAGVKKFLFTRDQHDVPKERHPAEIFPYDRYASLCAEVRAFAHQFGLKYHEPRLPPELFHHPRRITGTISSESESDRDRDRLIDPESGPRFSV